MRSRTDGMWWRTAIEAPGPGALARFYSELLGWPPADGDQHPMMHVDFQVGDLDSGVADAE